MKNLKDFILGRRYVFYILFSTFFALFSWAFYGVFFDNGYLNLEQGGLFLFILLWLGYPLSFIFYERSQKK